MSYKRFNYSFGNDSGSDSIALEAGTLVVNNSGQLVLHDGSTAGGNPVTSTYGDAQVASYLANYNGTINFVASPALITGVLDVSTNTLTAGTITNTVSPGLGTLVDNVESWAGAGAPYTYVWIGNNPNFMSIYNLGDVTGWVFYPIGHPEQAVTVTQMNPVGADSLGFSGALAYPGPYTAHSPNYTPPSPNNLEVTVNSHNWVLGTNGRTTFPVASVPASSVGQAGDMAGMVAFDGDYIYYCKQDYTGDSITVYTGVNEDHFDQYASYGFNKFLTDITGWTLSVPGMSPTGITVTNVDQSFNGGAQTGLSFSANVTYTSTNAFTFTAPSPTNIWVRSAWTSTNW